MATATFYVLVEPRFYGYRPDTLQSIHVAKMTTRKRPSGEGVVVKIALKIPDAVFEPLKPEVEIEVPMDRVTVQVKTEPVPEGGAG